jgi:hypothetical protein
MSHALGIEKEMTPEQIATRSDWSAKEKLNRLEEMKRKAMTSDDTKIDMEAVEVAIEGVKSGEAENADTKDNVRQL